MRDAGGVALSAALVGDPLAAGAELGSLEELVAAAGLDGAVRAEILALTPEVALVHATHAPRGPVSIRFARLEGARLPGHASARAAVILSAGLSEGGRVLPLVRRLRACLRDPALLEAALGARTREDLVRLLAAAEASAGEVALSGAEALALLGSSERGLDPVEATRRLASCGPNRIERVRGRALWLVALEQFASFFALLLWVAGALAWLAGMPELAVAIFGVIVINGAFSFLQEYRAERAVEALEQLLPHRITALRDGRSVRLAALELVPGDVVRLEEGDQVPADGQVLEAAGLRVDQGSLTGESHPLFKLPALPGEREQLPLLERHELLFAGTGVVAGSGSLLVVSTGMATAIGDVAELTQAVEEAASPLQREMRRVTRVVTLLATGFGAGFFALGVLSGRLPPAQGLLFGLGVIVANVPEGLLPTLTLALALGVQRMARRGSVVKRLSAVETLGATTVICTDKTGTLTENRMSVRFLYLPRAGRTLSLDEVGPDATEARELLEAAVLASQASAERGDPTEVALVQAAVRLGIDVDGLRREWPLRAPYPFDSFRKRMTLVRGVPGGAIAYLKGAPRESLLLCTGIGGGGAPPPLTDERQAEILAAHDRLASDGMRLLAVAVRALPEAQLGAGAASVERDLGVLGLLALRDPPRPEVAEAVALCRRARIRIAMVTGDYALTAQAIAREVGLVVRKALTGEELDRLPEPALRELLAEEGLLFARTSPAHKLRIVQALKAMGEVVAVTGDGVNDAPALKAADVGVAMGRRGSEVAKEAAVMVVTDDNFASIVAAIRLGRAAYSNIGKFVSYIFASNVPELVPFLLFVLFGIPLPLTLMQILAVDLGTDLLPALALGAEAPEPDVMERPPRPRSERLLGPGRLLRAYGFLGALEALLSIGAFFYTYWLAGWEPGLPMDAGGELYRRATTMTFGGIVAAQIGNVFACRTERESVFRAGLFSNRRVALGIGAEIALALVLVFVPPFPRVFGLAPLRPQEWSLLLAFPPLMLLAEEARKWVVRSLARRARPRARA